MAIRKKLPRTACTLKILERKALSLVKAGGISKEEALEKVAASFGHESWSMLAWDLSIRKGPLTEDRLLRAWSGYVMASTEHRIRALCYGSCSVWISAQCVLRGTFHEFVLLGEPCDLVTQRLGYQQDHVLLNNLIGCGDLFEFPDHEDPEFDADGRLIVEYYREAYTDEVGRAFLIEGPFTTDFGDLVNDAKRRLGLIPKDE